MRSSGWGISEVGRSEFGELWGETGSGGNRSLVDLWTVGKLVVKSN